MSNISKYIRYFEYQCEQHPDLLHAEDNLVFQIASIEEAYSDLKKLASEYVFRLPIYTSRVNMPSAGNLAKANMGGFMLVKWVSQRSGSVPALKQAFADTERIAMDIINKMIVDSRSDYELFDNSLDIEQDIRLSPILGTHASGYAGWFVTFEYNNYLSACPDDDVWSDGGETPSL